MTSERRLRRADGARLLELVGVSAVAMAQPVLGALGQSPERFLVVGADRWDIVVFGVLVAAGPALGIWSVGLLLGIASQRAKELWQALGVGMFVALLAVLSLREWLGIGFVSALVAGLLAWFAFVVLYEEIPSVRVWPRYLSPAAPIILAMFLFLSPVGDLVRPASAAAESRVDANGAPVFVLVFDELPLMTLVADDGRIDASLFPNFARLADEGTWYRNATTVHGLTLQALPAMLTGRYPASEVSAPSVANHPRNLFTLVADSYDLHVREHFELCPSALCGGTTTSSSRAIRELVGDAAAVLRDRLFPEAEPLLSVHGWDERTGPADVAAFEDLVAEIGVDDQSNSLFFQHLMLPHARWQYLPDGTRYNDPSPSSGLRAGDDYVWHEWRSGEAAAFAQVRHRVQTMWVDSMLGRLLDRLDALGIYDDALVVVTADHGVSLTNGEPHRAVVDGNHPEILWVPMFVKAPGQRSGGPTDANVETVDLLPIMADALDIELTWEIDGVPAGERESGRKHFFGEWNGEDRERGHVFDDAGFAAVIAGRHAAPTGVPFPFRAYSSGVRPALLGTPAADLAGAPSDLEFVFDEPDAWRAVDVDATVVPAYLSGAVRGLEGPAEVAVAVNGIIAGTGRTFDHDGDRAHFAMLLPRSALRAGSNDIELHLVAGPDARPVLRLIGRL